LLLQAGGKTIYVDPAPGSYDGRPRADVILITDIHGDHMAPKVVTIDQAGHCNRSRPKAGSLYHDKGRGNDYVLTYGGTRFYISADGKERRNERAE
jgi:L-ascorbate metabolism protein UlaG (beta-lactamase superfamily)